MIKYRYGLKTLYEDLKVELNKCCDSPNIMFGKKGGTLEDVIKCDHCGNEVFGYTIEEMIALWNNLLLSGKDHELPYMELVAW